MGDFEKRHYLVARDEVVAGPTTYRVRPYGEPWIGQEVYAYSPAEAVAIVSRGEAQGHILEVKTPREALLAIRAEIRGVHTETDANELALITDRLAEEGLLPTRVDTYEYTDQLAERLAEAHRLLREVREGRDVTSASGEIDEALALPPDIEAAVELRMKR